MGIRAPLIASMLLLAGMVLVSTWTLIPDGARIAVHFDLAGNPNGFAPKSIALTVMPLVALIVIFVFVLAGVGPQKSSRPLTEMPAFVVGWLGTMLILALAHIGIVMFARGVWINMTGNVAFFVGLLFAVLGNFLGKTERNNFVGIRTGWTMSSDYSWEKTNRLGGWIMVGVGFATLATLACAGPKLAQGVLLGGSLLLVVICVPLSRYYWKRDPDRQDLGRG